MDPCGLQQHLLQLQEDYVRDVHPVNIPILCAYNRHRYLQGIQRTGNERGQRIRKPGSLTS